MTTGYDFAFAGQQWQARASGALWWPERRWLIVADLHLGKSERMARRGGPLLPPYEVTATLDMLASEIALTDPAAVISLGDGFDDDAAGLALSDAVCDRLAAMATGRSWIWVSGNHDPSGVACARLGGETVVDLPAGPAPCPVMRHEAAGGPDISGHYHPCLRLAGTRRRCFLLGRDHLILPAFGTYTGGLAIDDPVLRALVPTGLAIACGARALPVPVGHVARPAARPPRLGRARG